MAHAGWLLALVVQLAAAAAAAPVPPPDWAAAFARAQLLYALGPLNDGVPENLRPEIGNGYTAWRLDSDTTYVGGVFSGRAPADLAAAPGPVPHRARVPAWGVGVQLDTQQQQQCVDEVGTALDLQRALLVRRALVTVAAAGARAPAQLRVEQTWFAHRTRRTLMVQQLVLATANGEPAPHEVRVALREAAGAPSQDVAFAPVHQNLSVRAWEGAIHTPETDWSALVRVGVAATPVPAAVTLPAGAVQCEWSFLTALRAAPLDSQQPALDAALDVSVGASLRPAALRAEHEQAWAALWAGGGVEVTGDMALARVLNSSLYYLLSAVRADWPWSISPGGLASDGYNGHTFWDCETWMFPVFAMLHPDVARGALAAYRFNLRDGARLKAQRYGRNGTMFPWESAFTGVESCPPQAPPGTNELHITADIAIALRQLWRLQSHDLDWLRTVGWPLLLGIGEFWASRARWDAALAAYVIDDVIPPDEYHCGNNSAYTNAAVALALEFGCEVAPLVGSACPAHWEAVARQLRVPFDAAAQMHPEFDGYRGDEIKQADVILMGFPLQWPMPLAVRRRDLEFYTNRTDPHGPAMTWSMTALGYLDVGALDVARTYFGRSFANAQPPYLVWTETPEGGTTNFLTGVGGFLQGVLSGFAGIRAWNSSVLQIWPRVLPTTGVSHSLRVRGLDYRGSALNLAFDAATTTLCLTREASSSEQLLVSGGTRVEVLRLSHPVVFPSAMRLTIHPAKVTL